MYKHNVLHAKISSMHYTVGRHIDRLRQPDSYRWYCTVDLLIAVRAQRRGLTMRNKIKNNNELNLKVLYSL